MFDRIQSLLSQEFPNEEFTEIENCHPRGLVIPKDRLIEISQCLHSNKETYFDQLTSISGVDNGIEQDSMEVIYHLYSIPNNESLTLKVIIDRSNPEVDSVTSIWRGANWHEREAFDLFGIRFNNHPDLRRILLPADWEGFPMRKNHDESESYHGMKIKHPDVESE